MVVWRGRVEMWLGVWVIYQVDVDANGGDGVL